MTECNGCGGCCDTIYARSTEELRAREAPPLADIEFMEEHWHPIGTMLTTIVYRCDVYDPETRRCTDYENRPPVCRGYPGFGKELTPDQLWHYPQCEFWADIPSAERPPNWVPVLLTTKPMP